MGVIGFICPNPPFFFVFLRFLSLFVFIFEQIQHYLRAKGKQLLRSTFYHQRTAAVYLSVFLLKAFDAPGLTVDGDVLVSGERPIAVVATKVLQMPRFLLRP